MVGSLAGFQQDLGGHGSGGGFSVGARHGNGHPVIFHDLPQKLRSGQHGKPPGRPPRRTRDCPGEWRRYIPPALCRAECFPPAARRTPRAPRDSRRRVRALSLASEPETRKPSSSRISARPLMLMPADSYKMNMHWFFKIYGIHNPHPLKREPESSGSCVFWPAAPRTRRAVYQNYNLFPEKSKSSVVPPPKERPFLRCPIKPGRKQGRNCKKCIKIRKKAGKYAVKNVENA